MNILLKLIACIDCVIFVSCLCWLMLFCIFACVVHSCNVVDASESRSLLVEGLVLTHVFRGSETWELFTNYYGKLSYCTAAYIYIASTRVFSNTFNHIYHKRYWHHSLHNFFFLSLFLLFSLNAHMLCFNRVRISAFPIVDWKLFSLNGFFKHGCYIICTVIFWLQH